MSKYKVSKYIKLLVAPVLVLGVTTMIVPHSYAQTASQRQTCMQWDGQKISAKNGSLNLPAGYGANGCDDSKGGNCTITADKKNGKVTGGTINCVAHPAGADLNGQGVTDPAADGSTSCTQSSCPLITKYVNPLIALLSALVGIVAVIAIIAGAIQVITSAGDPQQSAKGKNHIRSALIGIVAYVLLYAFLQWIIPGGIV